MSISVFKLLVALLLCGILNAEKNATILGVVHFPSRSHHILLSSLLKALAVKGHRVTMLSSFPLKTPVKNYEDIELKANFDYDSLTKMWLESHNISFFEKMSIMTTYIHQIDNSFFSNEAVKSLLESKKKYDLVIQTWFGNEAYLAFAHSLGKSIIAFSTVGSSLMNNRLTANPAPYSYVPNMFPPFPDEMNFLQRVGNTLSSIGMELYFHFYMQRDNELLIQKYFPHAPSTNELISNVSLVLLNAHFSIESPRPYVPNMIQVGGLHVEEPKELKGPLKQFMDSAKEGVVFFSLGSNVRSADVSNEKLKSIISCFAKLPLKVLWKYEGDDIPDLPSNVKVGKWLPQRDILSHPNLKLFVTHGGLLSTTEAIYHGVPMVGIPIFGDQDTNVDDGVRRGYSVKISFLDLNEDTLTTAIQEIVNNPRYREDVQRRSYILKDQPLKPIDNAVYWVEYVLRHNGAHHLKTSALKLKWYQYYLLDVTAFILVIALTLTFGTVLIVRKIWKFLKSKVCKSNKTLNRPSTKSKKKKSKLA